MNGIEEVVALNYLVGKLPKENRTKIGRAQPQSHLHSL